MKKIFLILLMGITILSYSQEKESEYFSFNKGGKKHLKPIKYILFNPKTDKKTTSKEEIHFYIKGERFKFSKKINKIDTCNIKYLKKIELSNAYELSNEEFKFRKQKLKEDKYWKNKKNQPPMPLTQNHNYFKTFVVEKYEDKILKYDVNWTYSGTRGFKVNRK
ncbi:hypothetical protein [Tenacibaculum haliotis]|uniref:hypothetical protein n=1 Tax=Tenacibaculum haliotis TaxID=1888914 RepID=UPI0021AE6E6D|nr:hypothetical protein [Tenacibaculum haliotis]MCT4698491.1 hypothetical protein [Tenacibaculum haliotis]